MRADEYLILSECVENGVSRGWRLAFKHLNVPSPVRDWLDEHENLIKDSIDTAVTTQICEYFKFDEPKQD